MKHDIRTDSTKGRLLWLTDGHTEIGIALDYGIRIVHLSCVGMENLMYEQPADLSDGFVTEEGWRIYGGHRLWTAPESERCCCPDNDTISYELLDNGVILQQPEDPWLKLQKTIRLCFSEDGSVFVEHTVRNTGHVPFTGASWGITTLAIGGQAEVWFDGGSKGCLKPERHLSVWDTGSLSDPRVRFTSDRVFAEHMLTDNLFKIGFFSHSGKAVLRSKGQAFTMTFEADPTGDYPDGGCNFELYLDNYIMELEALGKTHTLQPGDCTGHWERWQLMRISEEL